jgi:hypothetical protein
MAKHGFKIFRREMKRGGQIQGDLVFARDEAAQLPDGSRLRISPHPGTDT